MSADFIKEIPPSSDLGEQISTFKHLKHLHIQLEATKKQIPSFKNVECGKTFHSQLNHFMDLLSANIIDSIPIEPTQQDLHYLLKGCRIPNACIDKRCFAAIYRFLHTPDCNDRKTRVHLFIKKSIFRHFSLLLYSSNGNTILNTMKCIGKLLEYCSEFDPPKLQCILSIIEHEGRMVLQFISQIRPKYPRITLHTLRLICALFQTDVHCILKPSFRFNEGLNRIKKLYTKHTLSHDILDALSLIIYYLCDDFCTLDKLDSPYLAQYLDTLRFMLFNDDQRIIERALRSYFTLFQNAVKKPKDDFSIDVEDILSNPEYFAQEQIKKKYQEKYTNRGIIFAQTMKKYQKNDIDFDIPIVVHQLINKYYTAQTVHHMEFILLQRFIELLADTYDDRIRGSSLTCIHFLMRHRRQQILAQCVEYGLLSKLQLLLTQAKNRKLITFAVSIIRRVISENLNAVNDANIIDSLLRMGMNGDNDPFNAFKAIYTLTRGMRYAHPMYVKIVYDADVVSSVFTSLLELCKYEIPTSRVRESLWENVIFGTSRVLRMDYMDVKSLPAYGSIKQYNISETKIENQEYLMEWFSFLNIDPCH